MSKKEKKELEYRVPVAYVMGNVVSVYKTEAQLREDVRKKPIEGVDPEASQDVFFAGYNKYINEVLLKDFYADLKKKEDEAG